MTTPRSPEPSARRPAPPDQPGEPAPFDRPAGHAPSDGSGAPSPAGLRVRIWVGCMAGSLVASLGAAWVVATLAASDPSLDPVLGAAFAWAVVGLGVLTGFAMAQWLDHGIVGRLRALSRAAGSEQVTGGRGLGGAGWGELAVVEQGVGQLIGRVLGLRDELEEARRARSGLERALEGVLAGLEHWGHEGPEAMLQAEGPLAAVAEILNQRVERSEQSRDQSRAAALEIRAGVLRGLEEARETESQAERGFLEATALLTTVRELHRLRGELEQSLAPPEQAMPPGHPAQPGPSKPASAGRAGAAESGSPVLERYRAAAIAAIEEVMSASASSVERLAAGLAPVRVISDQVHAIANRATVVALEAALGAGREEAPPAPLDPRARPAPSRRAAELRRLAAEIQSLTTRTAELAREVDQQAAAAIERVRRLRERGLVRLELPSESTPAAEPASDAVRERTARLMDRVREMVSDAMQKGERLSAAGERASSAARRLVQRLEDEIPALEGLAARLEPESAPAGPGAEAPARGGLRLLEPRDLAPDAEPPAPGVEESL